MTVRRAGLRVLVVENEVLVRALMEEFLLDLGHSITGNAHSAQNAIAEAERTRPDIVLMDIGLNGPEDGIYAARQIRNRFGIPSIFISGRADIDTCTRAVLAEPLAYLAKPASLEQLDEALRRVVPHASPP